MEPLTPTEALTIPYIEEFWHKKGVFPPPRELRNRGVNDVSAMCQKPVFIKAMEKRGITIADGITEPPVDFSKAQLAAIMTMTDYLDQRSSTTKLKQLGLTTTQWNAWMKESKFKDYVHEISAKNFTDGVHMAQVGLAKKLESGDVNAIKYYYEVTGRYNGGEAGNQQNIRIVLTKLVEVLQRRIKDPELLAQIGRDFDTILSGGSLAPQIPAESMLPGVHGNL